MQNCSDESVALSTTQNELCDAICYGARNITFVIENKGKNLGLQEMSLSVQEIHSISTNISNRSVGDYIVSKCSGVKRTSRLCSMKSSKKEKRQIFDIDIRCMKHC